MTNPAHAANDKDELDIDLDLVGILQRRYAHIALGLFIGVTLAAVFYFQQTPIYESELSVLVGQRTSELTSTGTGNSVERATVQDEILSTHMELFASRRILEDARARGRLDLTFEDLTENLEVTKGGEGLAKNASVLKAAYRDPDPQLAADVLQAIYDCYLSYIEEKSQNVGKEAATLIADSLVQSEDALKIADRDYREFIADIPALITSDSNGIKDVHAARLATVELELSTVRQSLAQARSRLTAVRDFARTKKTEELTDVDVMTLISQEEAQRLLAVVNVNNAKYKYTSEEQLSRDTSRVSADVEYRKLLDLISKREQLKSSVGVGHPSYQSVLKEINTVEAFVERAQLKAAEQSAAEALDSILVKPAQMLAAYVNVLNNDIREGEAREIELLAISDEEGKLAKQTETSYLLSVSLKNDLERARSRYDEVFSRLQEINLTNSSSGFSTDLIVSPLPAEEPVWPSKIIIAALGLLSGGMLGVGFALLAEFTDRTFRDPKDVEHAVGAAILAHIPKLELSKVKQGQVGASAIAPSIAAFHDPHGSAAETFRVLRTSVMFLTKKDHKQTLMVTSPSPADGKSTTIANLAVSLAQAGRRVLLVDADLRRPTVAKTFGIAQPVGLSNYLHDEASLKECCHASEQSNLSICPDGAATSQPSELLQSERFVEFLAEARRQYDIVLIDTPPLLAVADPAIVADVVDGCILTVRISKNNRTLIERARAILADHDVRLDGVVVNGRDGKQGGFGYSSYNYYGKKEYGYMAKYRRYYSVKEPVDESSISRVNGTPLKHATTKRDGGTGPVAHQPFSHSQPPKTQASSSR